MLRPAGLLGPVTLVARGRDLGTDERGDATELDAVRLDGLVSFPDRVAERLELAPPTVALDALVGTSVRSGFRGRLQELLPGGGDALAYQLLDDVPTALLVSGVAVHVAGALGDRPRGATMPADLCAGYASGGTLQQLLATTGMPRDLPRQPAAPLAVDGDPRAWHEYDDLPPHSVRRVRRVDVWRESPSRAEVDAFFRDSHADEHGTETAVHEYTVRASLDVESRTFTACEAGHGALPWPECPGALGSASRVAGMRATEVRERVRVELAGPSTCTHLNDVLRSLAPVPALIDLLVADQTTRTT